MTTTKEMADWLRCMIGQGKPLIGLTIENAAKVSVALDRLVAIDAAVPEEVRELRAAVEQMEDGGSDCSLCNRLLAIAEKQAGELTEREALQAKSLAALAELRQRWNDATANWTDCEVELNRAQRDRDAARAEVEEAKKALKTAWDGNYNLAHNVAALYEARYESWMEADALRKERDAARAEVEQLRAELQGAKNELHAAGTVIVKLREEANEQRARAEAAEQAASVAEMDRRELRAMLAVANDKLDKRTQELLAAEAANEQAKLDPTCWWCKGHYPSAEEWEKHLPGCTSHPFAGSLGKLAMVTMWLGKWGMHEIGTADFWHAMEEMGMVPPAGCAGEPAVHGEPPANETHEQYIDRLRKDVDDRRADLERAMQRTSLYDHEQEMLEYAEEELREALESQAEGAAQ